MQNKESSKLCLLQHEREESSIEKLKFIKNIEKFKIEEK